MTDRDDLRDRLEELERRFPDRAERELSEAESHAIRVAAWYRRQSRFDPDTIDEAVHELLAAAREEVPADGLDDLTIADVNAAADRLGIAREVIEHVSKG